MTEKTGDQASVMTPEAAKRSGDTKVLKDDAEVKGKHDNEKTKTEVESSTRSGEAAAEDVPSKAAPRKTNFFLFCCSSPVHDKPGADETDSPPIQFSS